MAVGAAAPQAVEAPIDVRDDLSPHDWDAYVDTAPDASVYHLSAWADVIRDVFGHRTRYLAAIAGGHVVGVLPLVFFKSPLFGRFATSMPFLNYGGIVADSDAAAQALLAAAVTACRESRAAYLELRHTRRLFEHLAVRTHKVAMVLRLQPTVEQQWNALDRKLRNQVRKAEKSNLTVRVGGAELLTPFYDVLAENMRDLGTPVHGPGFFARMLAAFPERTRLLCVDLDGRAVAAAFVIQHRGTMEVPWASALRRYNPLCPNVLLYWAMLRLAIAQGCTVFDFGRSTAHEGTYQFKKQWGAEPAPLYWEYWQSGERELPDRSPKNPRFGGVIALWRRLPVAVTRAVGPMIVCHIP